MSGRRVSELMSVLFGLPGVQDVVRDLLVLHDYPPRDGGLPCIHSPAQWLPLWSITSQY